MSRWDEGFAGHRLWAAIDASRESLAAAEDHLGDSTDQREEHARLRRIADQVAAIRDSADPELVPAAVLEQLAQSFDQITASVQQFDGSDIAPLSTANTYADAALTQLVGLAAGGASGVGDGGAISELRQMVGEQLRAIEQEIADRLDQVAATDSKLAEQEQKADALEARLDTVVTEFQAQFSSAQEQRQAQFAAEVERARANLEQVSSEAKALVDSTVQATQAEMEKLFAESQAAEEAELTRLTERADTQFTEVSSHFDKAKGEIDALLEKAIAAVGTTGTVVLAGGYKKVADEESDAANKWRWWTVGALVGAILVTLFAVLHGVYTGFHAESFFSKWALSVPFAALAGYAGLESSKHRDQERKNREIQLQLASLDAYLVSLDPEEQAKVRINLAPRYFGELGTPSPETVP